MPAPLPTDTERQRRKAAVEEALRRGHAPPGQTGGTGRKGALRAGYEATGLNGNSAAAWLRTETAERDAGRPHFVPDWSLYQPPKPRIRVTAAMQRGDAPLPWQSDIDRLRAQVQKAEAAKRSEREEARRLQARVDELERLLSVHEAAKGLLSRDPEPWPVREVDHGLPGTPLLHVSDLQYGEVIQAGEIGGINAYGPEIAKQRYELLIDKTLELCFDHQVTPDYPNGLVYASNGDMVSGGIHDELRDTDDPGHILEQTFDVVDLQARGAARLAKQFNRVRMYFTPGNHGRLSKRPRSKGYGRDNVEYWLAVLVARRLSEWGVNNVEVIVPESGDALFDLHGYRHCFTHGDRVGSRGGAGFVGPAATVSRGMQKIRQYYAELGAPLDYVHFGHFHDSMKLTWGYCNGAVAGFSEYAMQGRFAPRTPAQWLLFCHDRYGISQQWEIQLGEKPRLNLQEAA